MRRRRNFWPAVALALLVAGLLARMGPLILVSALLLLIELASRLWERYGLERVEYSRRLSAGRIFCGEEVQLEVVIANRKALPLPWIEIEDEMPADIKMLTGKALPSSSIGRMEITHYFPMMWYEKVTRRYRLLCPQRGAYTFGPACIKTGDLFGLAQSETSVADLSTLIVYPRVLPLERLGIPSLHTLGEVRTRRSLHHDPVLTMGVRDYHAGDSLKHIHWKTSARTGSLQTKVYEPTTGVDVGIFLDVRTTMPPIIGTMPHLTELAIVTAASLCHKAAAEGYRVGLYVNEWRSQPGEVVRLPPSRHADQLPLMLENLAKVHSLPNECLPMGTLVLKEGTSLPWGSTVVVISAAPTEGLIGALHKVQRAGRVVALVVVGGESVPPARDGLNVYRVPEDRAWDELQSVPLKVAV